MQIETDIVDGVAVIKLSGRVESGAVDELKTTIQRLLDDGHREFVVNLERVPSIDSEGLGTIVCAYTEVSRRGGRLKLEGLSQRVRELLRLNDLTRLFEANGYRLSIRSTRASKTATLKLRSRRPA